MKVHDEALNTGSSQRTLSRQPNWPLWVEPLDEEDWPHRELRLGFDTQARLLETVVLIFESGDEMVIHAMPSSQAVLGTPPLSQRLTSPQADRLVAQLVQRYAGALGQRWKQPAGGGPGPGHR